MVMMVSWKGLFEIVLLAVLILPTNNSRTYCNDPGLIANGDRKFFKDGYRYKEDICCPPGTLVIYTCRDRYEIDGTEVIHCTDDGSWTNAAPKCREYPCRRFQPGDHVHVDNFELTNDTTFPVGTVITFRCEAAYHMRGLSSLLCIEGGWFGQPPKCEQYTCSRFDPGPHLHVDMFDETNVTAFPQGTVITFTCEAKYTLQGSSMSICRDGHWLGRVPTCKASQSCPLPSLEFGHFLGPCCEPGDSVTFFCNEDGGFCLQAPSAWPPRSATCLLTGVWSEPTPTCERCGCRRFQTEPHLHVNEFQGTNSSIFHDGTIITYGCEAGYMLFGPRSSLCSKGVWLGRTHKCEQVKCGLLKTPLNGYMNTTNTTAVGAKAKFGCYNGYILMGSAERLCVEEGQWDGTPARCLHKGMMGAGSRVSCPDPGTPDNGFRLLQGHFVPGSTVRFGCNPGYHRRGESTLQCLGNETWTSAPPQCLSRYYFDTNEVVREKIENRLHNARKQHSWHFVYLVFDHFGSVGPDNFRHIISLAKAITTKLFMTSARNLFGIISMGRDTAIVVDPMERWSLNVILQRLDQLPYTYGTAAPIKHALRELRKSIERVQELVYMRMGSPSYSIFILTDGTDGLRQHLMRYLGRQILQNGSLEMFGIGIRGYSQYAALRSLTWLPSEERIFMLRDYDAMKAIAEAINHGVDNVFDGDEVVEIFGRFVTPELYQKGLVRDGLDACPPKIRHFVYFLFDASTSIGAKNFRRGINLAKAITQVIVTEHDSCIGAAVIAERIHHIISPLVCYNTKDAIRLLDGIKYSNASGTTINGEVIWTILDSEAEALYFEEMNDIKFSFVIISDGKANISSYAKRGATSVWRRTPDVFCVGITESPNMESLEKLASGPPSTHVFVLQKNDVPNWLDTPLSSDISDFGVCGVASEYVRYPRSKEQAKPRKRRTDNRFWRGSGNAHLSERFWPWVVEISIEERPYEVACTGSIIDKKWILTAASCMASRWPLRYPDPSEVRVRAKLLTRNVQDRHWEGHPQELLVEEVIPHESFNISSLVNDIALLRLKDEITYEKHIRPICLPPAKGNIGAESTLYKEDELAMSIGWDTARAKSLGPSPEHLRHQQYRIGSEMDCFKEPHGEMYISKGVICGKSSNGSACVASGGSPLMQSTHDDQMVWTQVGIWSWGPIYCRLQSTDYFTDVSHYVPWIRRFVDAGAVVRAA